MLAGVYLIWQAMIDPKILRQETNDVAANLLRRGFEFDAAAYLALEERRKTLQVDAEQLRSERNSSAKRIGKAKAQGDDVEPLLAAVEVGDQKQLLLDHYLLFCRGDRDRDHRARRAPSD